jgi:hypothetical protein
MADRKSITASMIHSGFRFLKNGPVAKSKFTNMTMKNTRNPYLNHLLFRKEGSSLL